MEREQQQRAQEDRRRRVQRRPSAARAVQRVKGMARSLGGGGGKTAARKPSNRYPVVAAAKQPPLREFSRRAFVRARFVQNKKLGQWAANGRYIEREGAQAEGLRGVGFSKDSDAVQLSQQANAWQRAGDARIYRIVVSPEDGPQLDLVQYTRRFMTEVERQVGSPLEWVAIDHHNTDNPHVHVLLRGRGIDLSQDLVRSGLRHIAEDLATQTLGYKSEQEKRRELNNDIGARRLTQLDRLIAARVQAGPGGDLLVTETGLSRIQRMSGLQQKNEELRRKRIARLQKLEELGVAQRVGVVTWRLDDNWQSALKQLEILRTRSTMLLQHRELMTDPRCLPQVTKLQPGESLVGRSLGGGLDEATDRRYLLVEGADGRAHFIDRPDTAATIKPGTLVRLEGRAFASGHPGILVREYDLVIPASGFARAMSASPAVEKAARDEVEARDRSGRAIPEKTATAGFAAAMQRAMLAEQARLRDRRRDKSGKRTERPGGPELDRERNA